MSVLERAHARCGCGLSHGGGRPFAFAGTPRHFERDRPFTVTHLVADLTLDFDAKQVRGTARLSLARVDPTATEITLDAVAFAIERVTVGRKAAAYRYDGHALTVTVPVSVETTEVTVVYTATPRRGMYFLEPDEHVRDRPRQVWTQCQEEDARHFLPCHDKPHVKMTTELTVTVPVGFTVLSNGELVTKSTPRDGAWKFQWRMAQPHPSYLLTIVAGEFTELEANAGDVPLTYLVPVGREEDGQRTFGRTPQMMALFGQLTGVPYPWNKYAQVVVSDFIFGGMENTTATTLYEHVLLDKRASLDVTSDDLIAHELAHQWFGDYVTCRDWSEGWLNEGFATFMEHVWREKQLGRDEYHLGIKADLDAYLGEASGRYRRPVVCQTYDAPLDLFDRHLYEKGGLVLHLLRHELGDALFWRGVCVYLKRHAHGVVETRDLQRALEEVSGRSLGQLFDQWIYRPGHPQLEVNIAWEKKLLLVTVKQVQATADDVPAAFDLPLVLEVVGADGVARREKLRVQQRVESFSLPCETRPAFVVADPDMQVLGELAVRAPTDMLRAQLERAPSARGRWIAAGNLATSDDPVSIAALAATLANEREFWGVRAAAAEALGNIRARACCDALIPNVGIKHPKVRRAVLAALGRFRTTAAADAIRPRALRDPSYLVEAEAARALGRTRQPSAMDTLVELLERPSWADVVRVGAIDGLAALRDDRATPHLMARTRYGHPTRARRAAIMALPKLSSDRRGREHLEELLDDSDPHLRIDVARALAELGDPKARAALRARAEVDLDPRVRRRLKETLRDLGGEGKRGVDQVREELEKLQAEHAELKARLGQLEARLDPAPATRTAAPAAPEKPRKNKTERRKR